MNAADTIVEIARYMFARGGAARLNEIVHGVCIPDMAPDETGQWVLRCLSRAMNMNDIEAQLDGTYRLTARVMAQFAATERKPLDAALAAAETIAALLQPHAQRIEIAGSIRRRQPDVGDVEIVALTDHAPVALFDALRRASLQVIKSGNRYAQTIITHPKSGPIKVDLFTVPDPAEWGMLYFIRTGSADFVHRALAYWKQRTKGGYCHGNRLYRFSGEIVPTPEEDDVFAALGIKPIPPERRTAKAQE